jgi:PleD family two-component response regulator
VTNNILRSSKSPSFALPLGPHSDSAGSAPWPNRNTLYTAAAQLANVLAVQDRPGIDGNSVTTAARPTIAVIDDDCRVRESLADLLDCAGFGVRLFASSGEFLRSSALSQADCVISDVAMPTIDGFALQRLVREARPTLPVILVTGRRELVAAATEADRGGRTLFEKPFDRERFLAAINLELRRSGGRK